MSKHCPKCGCETERYAHGGCKPCGRVVKARFHAANKEKRNAENKAWRLANAEQVTARRRAARKADLPKAAAQMAAYRAKNPDKIKAIQERSYRKNPELYVRHARKRQSKIVQQFPRWADAQAMQKIYDEAQTLRDAGIDVEVDHVIPLQGELVSGLHCEFNLQILTKIANRSKKNRFDPEIHG